MRKSKASKNILLWVVLGLFTLFATYVLAVPEIVADAETPAWLIDQINYATNIRDAFNLSGFTYLVILCVVVIAVMVYKLSKNKSNRTVLKVAISGVALFAIYLLFTPALAFTFSDQQWLVDFSKLATDVTTYIDNNNGFLTIIGGGAVLAFIIHKNLK